MKDYTTDLTWQNSASQVKYMSCTLISQSGHFLSGRSWNLHQQRHMVSRTTNQFQSDLRAHFFENGVHQAQNGRFGPRNRNRQSTRPRGDCCRSGSRRKSREFWAWSFERTKEGTCFEVLRILKFWRWLNLKKSLIRRWQLCELRRRMLRKTTSKSLIGNCKLLLWTDAWLYL